jgi:hypothetical protein
VQGPLALIEEVGGRTGKAAIDPAILTDMAQGLVDRLDAATGPVIPAPKGATGAFSGSVGNVLVRSEQDDTLSRTGEAMRDLAVPGQLDEVERKLKSGPGLPELATVAGDDDPGGRLHGIMTPDRLEELEAPPPPGALPNLDHVLDEPNEPRQIEAPKPPTDPGVAASAPVLGRSGPQEP